MSDISLVFGSDFALTATGDLATVDGPPATLQRILRRLLTNPGSYIWQLNYGAGLARYIGQPASQSRLTAAILRQMRAEAFVSQSPAPTVSIAAQPSGIVTATISYADVATSQMQTMTVPLSGA